MSKLGFVSERPFKGAFAYTENCKKLTIWRAEKVIHNGHFSAFPGQILYREQGDAVVACGSGVLRLTYVSLDCSQTHIESTLAFARNLRARLA